MTQMIGPRPIVGLNGAVKRQILRDAPTAYWPCDETSGSTLADISGNGFHMTSVGAGVTFASESLLADGTKFFEITANDSGAMIAGSLGIPCPFDKSWSMCALVRRTVPSIIQYFLTIGDASLETEDTNLQVYVGAANDNALQITWERDAGVNTTYTPVVAGRSTSIHMFHVVKDNDALELRTYIDGRTFFPNALSAGSLNPTGGTGTMNTYLGGGSTASPSRLVIGHVAFFYDKVLTEDRIHAHAMAAGRMLR